MVVRTATAASLLSLAIAGAAPAETEVLSGTVQVDEGFTSSEILVAQFDEDGGNRELTSVELSLRSEVVGELITNGSGVPVAYEIEHDAAWTLEREPLGETHAIVAGVAPNSFAGAVFFFDSDELPVLIDDPAALSLWTGTGERSIGADSMFSISADPPGEIEIPAVGGLRWTVTYTWSPATPPACPADLNGNGVVAFPDLVTLLDSWGDCPEPCIADIVPNGAVDVIDLLTMLGSWGPCPGG